MFHVQILPSHQFRQVRNSEYGTHSAHLITSSSLTSGSCSYSRLGRLFNPSIVTHGLRAKLVRDLLVPGQCGQGQWLECPVGACRDVVGGVYRNRCIGVGKGGMTCVFLFVLTLGAHGWQAVHYNT
jgi:hypothetical protein